MPVDGKRKVHVMANSDSIDDNSDCFKIRCTGELFTDYETFMERLFSYQARQWSCSLTGKGGMTLEEALLCESKAQRKVDDAFPEIFVEPLCKMVHMSQVRMDELVELAFKRLSAHLPGEVVSYTPKAGGKTIEVTVVRPLEVDEDWWMDMDQGTPLPEKYEVEPSVEGSVIATEEGGGSTALEVEAAELKRFKGKGVSRITIKAKLKTVGSRASYWQAPFLCEADYVCKFGMQKELPPHLKRLKLQHDVRTGKMDKEALNADPSMAPAPAKKAKKIKSVSTFDPSKDALKHVSTPLRKKIWQVSEKNWQLANPAKDPNEMHVPEVALILYTSYLDGGEKEAAECEMQVEEYMDECHALISLMMLTWPKETLKLLIALEQPPADAEPLDKPHVQLLSVPVEDTIIPADPSLESRPPPCEVFAVPDTEYILPNHMVGRVLALWDFFARFGRVVNVTPFEFDHLCAALCADEQSPLALEAILGLLRFILREREAAMPPPKEEEPPPPGEEGAEGAEKVVVPLPVKIELNEVMIGDFAIPKAPAVDEGTWVSIFGMLLEALRSVSPYDAILSEEAERFLRASGYENMGVEYRIELLECLVEQSVEQPSVHKHLDKSLDETKELHKNLRDEEAALREQKKLARQGKMQAIERIKSQVLGEDIGGEDEGGSERGGTPTPKMLDGVGPAKLLEGHGVGSTDVDLDDDDVAAGAASPVVASSPAAPTPLVPPPKGKGGGKGGGKLSAKQVKLLKEGEKIDKAKQKEVAAAAKAARQQQKEEEAKLEEEERQAKECMHRSFESELEKCAVRVTQLGQDRDKRDYWLFGGKEWRVYVRDRGVVSRRRPAYLGDDGVPTEGGINEEEGSRGLELWGFYDQPEQVDGLLGHLFQNGQREGRLYEELSRKYMRVTHNMRRRNQDLMKSEVMLHSDVRRSVRIKTEVVARQLPHMSYVNTLKLPEDANKQPRSSRRSAGS